MEYLSLREIGRRLGIPPSSVVYYKDRFSQYIPHQLGSGRRKKYTLEALKIFREIREMFNDNLSADEVEKKLARRAPAKDLKSAKGDSIFTDPAVRSVSSEAESLERDMSTAMGKLSDLLENQAQFKTEIESLRNEIYSLKQEKDDLDRRHRNKIKNLELELNSLKNRSRYEEQRARQQSAGAGAKQQTSGAGNQYTSQGNTPASPPPVLLNAPLVIKTHHNEYLGVADSRNHFNLQEFIKIIKNNGDHRKNISLNWRKFGGGWHLRIQSMNPGTGRRHEHILEALLITTPSNNRVTLLNRFTVDGSNVPRSFLLVLFRRIKEGFYN